MTSPELSHLQLLTMVGELGSLGRAAEKLGISQPAASKRMDQLERRLGLRLLDRNSRGSALTAEGKAVCQWAEKVVATFDALLVGAAALRADLGNDLRVASSMTLAEQFVPRWIGALRRQLPDVVVSLRMTTSKQVAELAATGEVGLGFVEAPTVPPGLSSRVVGTDRLVVVVGRTTRGPTAASRSAWPNWPPRAYCFARADRARAKPWSASCPTRRSTRPSR